MKNLNWKINRMRIVLLGKWYSRLIFFILQNGVISFYVNVYASSRKPILPSSIDEFADLYKTDGYLGMWVSLFVVGFLIVWLPIDEDPLVAAVKDGGMERARQFGKDAKTPEELMQTLKTVSKGVRK